MLEQLCGKRLERARRDEAGERAIATCMGQHQRGVIVFDGLQSGKQARGSRVLVRPPHRRRQAAFGCGQVVHGLCGVEDGAVAGAAA
ncbi:hypothetical protein SDC9_147259 [bioreactor metagenome]|uniref:Uncharacterized protein n=1 Tax=bioreactor metagenome TaxID=1076179 RepID=A0A645EDE3_9ZZZZ